MVSQISVCAEQPLNDAALLNGLIQLLSCYLHPTECQKVERAFWAASQAHLGQKRYSGEPYIIHPVAVAEILASLQFDVETIVAALLHDTLEDTKLTKLELQQQFGEAVADLVDGVSTLTQIKFMNRRHAQAENLRKMLFAMAKDLRVICIKLADRLHNMRTISSLPMERKVRKAHETLEIYTPIAHRLGMYNICLELEDLCFQTIYPKRYQIISHAIQHHSPKRLELISQVKQTISNELTKQGLETAVVSCREKHLYRIYQKMKERQQGLKDIIDIYGFRVICEQDKDCYLILGYLHQLFKPVPGRFKDYIAIPKANGYQSLHTTLFGPYGLPIEVQIRSQTMHRLAERGIAAHWLYRNQIQCDQTQINARIWLERLLELQKESCSTDFIEHVKQDLTDEEVYVFSPKGKVIRLPHGATPVDFAFMIHSSIGEQCVGARIDRQTAPLSTLLTSGQTIEIITAPGAKPNPSWLNFVVTSKARAAIKNHLKNLQHQDCIQLGKHLLANALMIPIEGLERYLLQHQSIWIENHLSKKPKELFYQIGKGRVLASVLARKLLHCPANSGEANLPLSVNSTSLAITGSDGLQVSFASCCYPIPGDPIVGLLQEELGLEVHWEACPKVLHQLNRAQHCQSLVWAELILTSLLTHLHITVSDMPNSFEPVINVVNQHSSNINSWQMSVLDQDYHQIDCLLAVYNKQQVDKLMNDLGLLSSVRSVLRVR